MDGRTSLKPLKRECAIPPRFQRRGASWRVFGDKLLADDEIKALLLHFFEIAGMPVNDIELHKNALDELEAILLIRPNDEISQEGIE